MAVAHAAAGDVDTTLNFLAPDWPAGAPVRTCAFDPPDGGPRFNARLQPQPVTVHDARPQRAQFDLATQGFALLDHPSVMSDWWDVQALEQVHFAEAADLARRLTGAREAIVFDHTLRRRAAHKPALDGSGGSFAAVREPVGRVHADYTPWSGPLCSRFVERQPLTTWERSVPGEYGFYSNVNPNVDHVRWAQQKERRIPNLVANRPTQLFNGYGDQVAGLYAGLDLKKFF